MLADRFGLEDEAYWTDPWANRKAMQRPLMQNGQEAFVIGAPKVVALDRHRTLPLAILRVRKAQGGSPVDFRASAVVAAWDANARRLSARLAFPKAAPAPKPQAGAPAAKGDSFSGDATAMVSDAATLDLAARLQLPLEGNEYRVSLHCLNKTSNACRIKVIDSAAFQDEAAAEFLRAYREEQAGPAKIHPSADEPGKGPTFYGKQSLSPEIPEEAGIALSAQRVTVMRADRPCVLYGSFRLPVQAPEPEAAAKSAAKSARNAATTASAPTAFVPIGLMMTGSVTPAPVVLNINAPSHEPLVKTADGSFAVGYFALDLRAHAALADTVQTWFIYAISGEVMAGPSLAAFVNPVLTWKTGEELAREAESAVTGS